MQRLNSVGILLHNLTGETLLTKGCTVHHGEYFVATEQVGRNLQANYGDLLPEIELELDELESLRVFTAYTKETLDLALGQEDAESTNELESDSESEQGDTTESTNEVEPNSEPEQGDTTESNATTGQSEETQVDAQEDNAEITLGDDSGLLLPSLEDDDDVDTLQTVLNLTNSADDTQGQAEEDAPSATDAPKRGRPPKVKE